MALRVMTPGTPAQMASRTTGMPIAAEIRRSFSPLEPVVEGESEFPGIVADSVSVPLRLVLRLDVGQIRRDEPG